MTITFLKTRHEDDGAIEVFEVTLPSHTGMIIPHLHHHFDESILGVNGLVQWTLNGKQMQIGPGQQLEIPRGAPHSFINLQATSARFLCIHTPGCIGPEYFEELAQALHEEDPPNYATLGAIMARYGIIPARK